VLYVSSDFNPVVAEAAMEFLERCWIRRQVHKLPIEWLLLLLIIY